MPRRARGRRGVASSRSIVGEQEVVATTRQIENLTLDAEIARFLSMRPPRFMGTEGSRRAMDWLNEIEELFNLVHYTDDMRLSLAVYQLKEGAKDWWQTSLIALQVQDIEPSWTVFMQKFREKFCPPSFFVTQATEFHNLRQGEMTVAEYEVAFSRLLRYAPHVATSQEAVVAQFIRGLNDHLHTHVTIGRPTTYAEVLELAKSIEASLGRRQHHESAQVVSSSYSGKPTQKQSGFGSSSSSNLKARGKQFKKPGTSSSSSGSDRGASIQRYSGPYCDHCGGRHISDQCFGFSGICYICGQTGHVARICPQKTGKAVQGGHTSRPPSRFSESVPSVQQPSRAPQQSRGRGSQSRPPTVNALSHEEAQANPDSYFVEPDEQRPSGRGSRQD